MEQNPRWLTTAEVAKSLGHPSRVKSNRYLRQLEKYDFIEVRRKIGSNELEYRIKTQK